MIAAKHTLELEAVLNGMAIRVHVEVEAGEVTANDHEDGNPILADVNNVKTLLASAIGSELKKLEDMDHGHNGKSIEDLRPRKGTPQLLVVPKAGRVH